jgi:hypothetical protein
MGTVSNKRANEDHVEKRHLARGVIRDFVAAAVTG